MTSVESCLKKLPPGAASPDKIELYACSKPLSIPDPYVPIYFTDNQMQVANKLEKLINAITQELFERVTIQTRKIYEERGEK